METRLYSIYRDAPSRSVRSGMLERVGVHILPPACIPCCRRFVIARSRVSGAAAVSEDEEVCREGEGRAEPGVSAAIQAPEPYGAVIRLHLVARSVRPVSNARFCRSDMQLPTTRSIQPRAGGQDMPIAASCDAAQASPPSVECSRSQSREI